MSDYDNIRNALNYLDPNDRDFWIRIGAAIKDHQGEEGFTLWDDWSRHSDSYKPSDAKAVWKSLKPGHIRINTLFYHARENGYRPEKPYTPPTAEELAARQAAARARRAEAERQEIQQREKARRTAGYIWTQAAPADPSHPYLKSKGINNPVLLSGIRQNEYKGSLNLVVPVYHEGRLANIQTIGADGGKRFLNGGQVKGGYSVVGSVDDMAKGLVIAEGFATAASIHAATGRPVIVAFNAGNMVAVAEKLAQTLPQNVPVTIAADNDASQTGIQKAREAAALLGSRARTVQPEFTMTQIRDYQRGRSGSDTPPLPSDFNDLYLLAGIEAVRAQMAAALPTPERQPENLPSLSRRVAPDEIRTQAEVLQGQPVARLEENQLGMPTDGGMKAVKEWADLVFKRQGSAAVHPALGKITLDRRGINDSLGHGNFNPYKNLAFAAVKDVLERGTLVAADYSRKDEHSYYVSAPVDINGKANILTAVAHLDANTQRMYLHSVILKENLLHLHVSKTKKNESPERLSVPDAADEDILLQGSDSVKKNPGGSRKHPDGITSLQVRNLISDALAHKLHPEQEQNIAQQPERQLVNEKKVREFLTTHPLQLHRDITSKAELSSRDIKTEGDLAQWRNARRQPETTQVSETPRPEAARNAAFSMPAANAGQTGQEQHMAQQPEKQPETPAEPAAPAADPEWEQTVADQRRLDSERRAERAPWRDFPPVIRNGGLGSLKNESEYAAAKGGDSTEAVKLVNKLLKEETVQQFREMIGDRKPVIVSVSATESAGRNKIPLAMAQALGSRLDLPVDTDIQQINKVSRTGSGIDHRLAFQPVFDG